MLHTAICSHCRKEGVAGMGWLNHERRQQGRSSWNTVIHLFHWGKWVLMEFSFLIKQPFHTTLNFLFKQNFQIGCCKKSNKKTLHKMQKLRIPDACWFLLFLANVALDILSIWALGICYFGSDTLVAVFDCRSQLPRFKAVMGNQMAVWTFMFSLPDHPLSLNFRRSVWGFRLGGIWLRVATKVLQSGNKANKFGTGHQEIKYDPSLWSAKSRLLSFGWVKFFFSNL